MFLLGIYEIRYSYFHPAVWISGPHACPALPCFQIDFSEWHNGVWYSCCLLSPCTVTAQPSLTFCENTLVFYFFGVELALLWHSPDVIISVVSSIFWPLFLLTLVLNPLNAPFLTVCFVWCVIVPGSQHSHSLFYHLELAFGFLQVRKRKNTGLMEK